MVARCVIAAACVAAATFSGVGLRSASAARGGGPAVVGISPSADSLPANLLRFYIEFSSPMRLNEAGAHLALLDARGVEVRNVFLRYKEELWDGRRRRLTVFFDPGRIKRGLRPNLEPGMPLAVGRRYTLRVRAGWRDATGAPLAQPFSKTFTVIAPLRTRLEVSEWRISNPRIGTHDSLVVTVPRPLDHALALRLIGVEDAAGTPLRGSIALENHDRRIVLRPSRAWRRGEYHLVVGGTLEDIAGNSVQRAFDVDHHDASSHGDDALELVRRRFATR